MYVEIAPISTNGAGVGKNEHQMGTFEFPVLCRLRP